jgi:hydrogenase/urease accessory protein HupE
MKKYSSYFYTMMVLALIGWFAGYTLVTTVNYGASAVMFVIGFIFWFAGVMAPDNEKYRGQ